MGSLRKLLQNAVGAAGTVVERATEIDPSEVARDLLQRGKETAAKAVEVGGKAVRAANDALQSETAQGLRQQAGELLEDAQETVSSAIESGKKKIKDLGGPSL